MNLTSPRSRLALLLAVVLLGASSAFAAACGGGEKSDQDVEALLDRAFRQPLKSADVKIDARLQVDGLQGFERPVRIEASGPYIDGDGTFPKVDIDLKIGTQGGGQTVESGFLSTGTRAFVKFGGQFYEQPRENVARANRELRKTSKRAKGSLGDLGLSPREWVRDARQEDDEKVAGVETAHLSGRLDVRRAASDLNEFVKRSGAALGSSAGDAPNPLSKKDIDTITQVVEDPSFDVYVGKKDDVIRRVSADITFKVPEKDRSKVGRIKGGSLRFTVELGDVNGDQVIKAPARSRPISTLTRQLGGAGALGALGGGGGSAQGGASGGAPAAGGAGSDTGTTPQSGSGAGAPGGGGVEAFQKYADCLDATKPDDAQARARCAELLR